ncbi:hypothetical protein IEO21_08925 [Rhodonia placenta]|uniref:Aldehyde dehydrogenase domain-containing protein n=1 Tax=Rhodonia placenta TaxID=104341 RepID=A0A8H7NVQ9_9APHY|nr:hypothetical protein IEO21_08925 [Postia placenta]
MSVPFIHLYINGGECPASSQATFDVLNPFNGTLVTRVASASRTDCKRAVDAAADAFRTWEHSPLGSRRDYLLKAADLLTTPRYQEKAASALKEETSAGDFLVGFNLHVATEWLRWIATLVSELKGETFPSSVPGGQVVALRRAQGVILAIAPWNAPLFLTVRAICYPIICGNTVVLKTSEISPRCQYLIAELLAEAGLPKGVLNVIHTSKEDTPARTAEIIADPAIKKINFTGSDRVGKILAAEAAKYLKPCVFELGGKAPVIVLDDADVERAAKAITFSALLFSGQICMSTERVIVQRGAGTSLTKALVDEFSKLRSGGPEEKLGAQFSESSAENIVSMLREARVEGARFLLGDGKRDGAVVQPHIVAGVKPGMKLWERESFGPVVTLTEVDTIDEAVELANATEYSLGAGLWTTNVHHAMDVSMRIRAGCVTVNGPTAHLEDARDHTGLGGASGYGRFSVHEFTDVRMVVLNGTNSPSYP